MSTPIQNPNARLQNAAIYLLIGGYAVVMFVAAWYKYNHYGYGYDQVDFEQAVWATTQGRPFFDSRFNFTDTVFGMDFMPSLALFVPFYAVLPHAMTMAAIETVVIALGALPVYWLAREVVGGRLVGLTFAAIYLLYPTIQYVNLFAFNMRPLGVTPLLFALWFLHQRRWLPFVLAAGLALLARTDVALTVAALGMYALLVVRPLPTAARYGLPVLLGGLLYFFVSLYLIVPAFTYPCVDSAGTNQVQTNTPTLPSPTRGEGIGEDSGSDVGGSGCGERSNFLVGYYSHLGGSTSFGEVIGYVLTHPLEVAQLVFTGQKLGYVAWLLLPGLFLALFYPPAWVLLIPTLGLNLLTNRGSQLEYYTHYQLLLIPGLMVGAIFGFRNLQRLAQRTTVGARFVTSNPPDERGRYGGPHPAVLVVMLLACAAINLASGNPVYRAFRYVESAARVAAADALVASVPKEAGVAATSSLGPHLLPRWYIYNYPPAAYTPYDEDYNFAAGSRVAPASGRLDYILLDTKARVLRESDRVAKLRNDPRWAMAAEREGFVLFKRQR